ncbi:MAG TPA: hypothetical protein VMB26_10240 [Candidatus Binataceae bacterium]|nr:hypothetical protein [Candidatus Binataceae bacterium]
MRTFLLVFVFMTILLPISVAGRFCPINQTIAQAADNNPCAPPNQITGSYEETAWKLFVAATCPVNSDQYPYVVWENWIEQSQMFPADPENGLKVPSSLARLNMNTHALHGSPLTLSKSPGLLTKVFGQMGGADQDCNKAAAPPGNEPDVVICEEVRENGPDQDYIAGDGLWNRPGQVQAAFSKGGIHFPAPAIEIKADWIELSTIGYDCGNLPPSLTSTVHVETINGNCYALAGFNLMSKLLGQWLWATWEPQNTSTNPNRCEVLGCTDLFGSNPPRTNGANTQLTRVLANLENQANLAPEFRNYRLDGVQTTFLVNNGAPTLLGNSIVEGENGGVPLTQSSCITCHAVSSIKSDGTDGITLLNSNPVGIPAALPSKDWTRRDFTWSLSEACPNSPFQPCD